MPERSVMADPVLPGSPRLVVEVVPSADLPARTAALIAARAAEALTDRGRCVIAISGGSTPGPMLSDLFMRDLAWDRVAVLQVDERLAPAGHAERNLTDLQRRLARTPAAAADLRPMPVEAKDVEAATDDYAATLRDVAGDPPVIDVVQLGLGADGHVASLVPNDPALDVTAADVALTGTYQGRRRMTLTYPVINRARTLVWMVAGSEKSAAVRGLVTTDPALPAARVRRDAILFTDDASLGR